MASKLNETHNPSLRSWVNSANEPDNGFPIQNLPFAAYRRKGSSEPFGTGVGIGDQILDLAKVANSGVFDGDAQVAVNAACGTSLNELMALPSRYWSALRRAISLALCEGSTAQQQLSAALVAQNAVEFAVPARIGDFTDMYTSVHHATNIGRLFRPNNPLMPNFKWLPVGYHGRASSIGVSGQNFHRPHGQIMLADASEPVVEPCRRLDYELEVGIWVGQGNPLGQPVTLDQADDHVFGLCLLNDWSARDIQAWEYQPLGPFLAKNFATTISPWLVTLEAVEPYRVPWTRPVDDPQPLAYLDSADNRGRGGIDLQIESWLSTAQMQAQGMAPHRLSNSSFKHSYWSVAQMIAHHTVGGCNLVAGDLIGSGTQSGPGEQEAAALIELTRGGKQPVTLHNGEQRAFLEDGDTVVLKGWCERAGFPRISLGDCVGTVLPAQAA